MTPKSTLFGLVRFLGVTEEFVPTLDQQKAFDDEVDVGEYVEGEAFSKNSVVGPRRGRGVAPEEEDVLEGMEG